MDMTTLVLFGIIVAMSIPYLMRRRARLGRQSEGDK
jgi:hypothetical protein